MPFEFVISDILWASAADLRCPIHETAESTCASPTPSWARWLVRSQLSIPSPHAAPHIPKPSGTWWSPMPAPCSELRSRGQRCAMHRAVSRTGSAGAWLEPLVRPHLADAGRADSSRGDARDLPAGNLARGATALSGAVEAAGAVDAQTAARPQAPWTPANGRRRPQLPQPTSPSVVPNHYPSTKPGQVH